jgi:hypothetical protein
MKEKREKKERRRQQGRKIEKKGRFLIFYFLSHVSTFGFGRMFSDVLIKWGFRKKVRNNDRAN